MFNGVFPYVIVMYGRDLFGRQSALIRRAPNMFFDVTDPYA